MPRMPYDAVALPGLFVVRAGSKGDVADVYACTRELAAARKSQGGRLVVIVILGKHTAPPDEAFRRAQAACLPEIHDHASRMLVVIEGSGFTTAIKRSALTAIRILAGSRYDYEVYTSVEEALVTRPPPELHGEGRAALAELRRRGFVRGPGA
jgi:hypothetical protein